MKVCLAVGGSDSCAGAGIQADLATFNALGVQGCCAITALTAQNPHNIRSILPTSIQHFRAELEAIFDYYDVGVVKTGMLVDAAHIETLMAVLHQSHHQKQLIVDPVLVASSGKPLLDHDGLSQLKLLCQEASLVTPNRPEMLVLASVQDQGSDTLALAKGMAKQWQASVLLKGGHMNANILKDVLISTCGDTKTFKHKKLLLKVGSAHGTGCRLASAIAAIQCRGFSIDVSIDQAVRWLHNELLKFSIDGCKGDDKYVR